MSRFFWSKLKDFGPSARHLHAMSYDPKRRRAVLFGGATPSSLLGDTWEWDGQYWTQVSDIGPSSRRSHALTWDAKSERVILFGGVSTGATGELVVGDTWDWDGDSWTQLDDDGPSVRFAMAVASDLRRQRVVLFGGAHKEPEVGINRDTWEWDGSSWTQQEDVGPPARSGHAMCFDEVSAQTILFGGVALDGSADAATWGWNGTRWAQLTAFGPNGRLNTAIAGGDKHIVLFGGRDSLGSAAPPRGDTWVWDGKVWTQRQDIGPPGRGGHAVVFDTVRQRVMLFGGQIAGAVVGDTWELTERPET